MSTARLPALTSPVPTSPPVPTSLPELTAAARAGRLGPDPAGHVVTVGFVTRQSARHLGRGQAYRNQVVSLRLGQVVGSCAVEPGEAPDQGVDDCVGRTVAELLDHPHPGIRFAALDAYLQALRPHEAAVAAGDAEAVTVPAGDSLARSMFRAAAVVDLLPVRAGQRVLVVGVVNSLLAQLRRRGVRYVACDRAGGRTEWSEPIVPDALSAVDGCDALLVSGMTLGNGTFPPLLDHARRAGKPLVVFAQTGSGVVPWLWPGGVTAACAEPYPFFWLHGGPTTVYRYRRDITVDARESGC